MALKKLPYLSLFTSDYVKDTRILSLEARAVWMDMLCMMHDGERRGYLTRGGSPVTTDQLARFCGCSPEVARRATEEIVTSGVASRDEAGAIYSRRILRDEKRRRAAATNGRKGGNPWLKDQDNPEVNGADNQTVEIEMGLGMEMESGVPEGGAGGKPGGFPAFWSAYPKKVAKAEALKAWGKLKPDHDLQSRILAALERQKRSAQWTRDDGQFVPHPTTWLNQGRWDDELPTAQARAPNSRTARDQVIDDALAEARRLDELEREADDPRGTHQLG